MEGVYIHFANCGTLRLQPILLMASIHRYGCLVCLNLHGKKYFFTSISQATIKWHNIKSNIFPGLSTKVCNFQFETVFVLKENRKVFNEEWFRERFQERSRMPFRFLLICISLRFSRSMPIADFCELHTKTYYHY